MSVELTSFRLLICPVLREIGYVNRKLDVRVCVEGAEKLL
jgi:hypothetical protein